MPANIRIFFEQCNVIEFIMCPFISQYSAEQTISDENEILRQNYLELQ